MFKKIQKRDGKIVNFNAEKIVDAIAAAGAATEEFKYDRAKQLAEKVTKSLFALQRSNKSKILLSKF